MGQKTVAPCHGMVVFFPGMEIFPSQHGSISSPANRYTAAQRHYYKNVKKKVW